MENTPSPHSTEQIISAVAKLSLSELDRVFDRVLELWAERKAGRLSPVESELLVRINQGLPPELRERLAFLKARREDESITDAEYEELTRLSDQAEELHAERMAAMVELAGLRGVSLPELMNQLGIHFPENV